MRDVAAIETLRAHLALPQITLLGHSAGGSVAMQYALTHPDHARALILYSTTATTNKAWAAQLVANLQWFKDEPWFADAVRGLELDETATTQAEIDESWRLVEPLYFKDWTHDSARLGPFIARSKIAFDVYKHRETGAPELLPQLTKLHLPALVLTGERDFICGVVPSTWIAERLPGAKLVVIANAGHVSHIEQPETFGRAIAELAATLR